MRNKIVNELPYIKKLIAEGEHQQLDFKFEISDSKKIARTLAAFANTDGGKLLIGVKDNGSITGVKTDEEYYMIEAAAEIHCKPSVPFEFRKWIVDGKCVLEITIPKGNPPVMAKDERGSWQAYVRINDENFIADKILQEYWKRKNNHKGTYLSYTKSENELLLYLEKNDHITVEKFAKVAHITLKHAEEIILKLLSLEVIKIEFNGHKTIFTLAK